MAISGIIPIENRGFYLIIFTLVVVIGQDSGSFIVRSFTAARIVHRNSENPPVAQHRSEAAIGGAGVVRPGWVLETRRRRDGLRPSNNDIFFKQRNDSRLHGVADIGSDGASASKTAMTEFSQGVPAKPGSRGSAAEVRRGRSRSAFMGAATAIGSGGEA